MSFLDRILLGARSLFAALGIPAVLCIPCLSSTSWAASFSFVTPIPSSQFGIRADATAGTYFHLTGSVSVDGLGFWDSGQDGLSSSYRIGLWDGLGIPFLPAPPPNLLLEGSVPAGSAAPLVDGWRFLDLPDLILGPGYYVVGALKLDPGPSSDLAFFQSTPFGQFPGYILEVDFAAFAFTRQEPGRGFQAPDSWSTGLGGGFGPTLFVVPEPGSALGLVLGLALLARWRPAGPSPI